MKKNSGFTLIELMIVVTVIGILSAVAYPSYRNYVTKARRSDVQQLMLDIVNRQEQYMLNVRNYTDQPGQLNIQKDGWSCSSSNCVHDNNFYTVTVTVSSGPPSFTITATENNNNGDGNLTLNNVGVKTPSDKW